MIAARTDELALQYRARTIDLPAKRILVTRYHGTDQEKDLSEPANCGGYGRVRHFKRYGNRRWVPNPLPIDPAYHALGTSPANEIRAQVFQSAGCHLRCWYCFVPYASLAADTNRSEWLSASDLIDRLLAEGDARPRVIDLSGGEPGLIPEWIIWMLEEIRNRGLESEFYLWSDDSLSVDYGGRFLTRDQQELLAGCRFYGRVGCFKGFDETSFAFNTGANAELFARQFLVMERLIASGLDAYAYVTLTAPSSVGISDSVRTFVDRLQRVSENLPLRTVPLEIHVFTPVESRLNDSRRAALDVQRAAVDTWTRELETRFSSEMRQLPIWAVPLAI